MFDLEDDLDTNLCMHCLGPYKARRMGQRFCSNKCRVYHNRPPQNAHSSPTKARESREFFDTAKLMGERLYNLPTTERLGHMQEIIEEARQGNTKLREILSNWKLRNPDPECEVWMYPRRDQSYCTIAQAAQNYCRKFWNANVEDVVYDRVPEPPTGEVE